jgi:predicted Zn-ribbon and HTH transcriptional regulator
MAGFGVIFCLVALRSNSALSRTRRRVGSGYSISTTGDAMYSEDKRSIPSYRRSSQRVVYQVPPRCPSCGASLNTEQVEWVGPLQTQCPYCLATIEATERDF